MAKGNFGERLKREREMREVSLEEISNATRIPGRYLEALENEAWSKLPGGVFARGFVRTVARYLGLDEESLLGEYDLARNKEPAAAPPQPRPPAVPRWVPAVALLLFLLVIAAGAFYGWRFYSAHRAAKRAQAATLQLPSPSGVVPPAASGLSATDSGSSTASTSSPLDLSVSTSAATRVRVVADGALLLDGEMAADETRHFSARDRFEVTAADSSAVLLELNGQAMPPIGAPGASGTISLSRNDLGQAAGGTAQP